MASDLTTQYIAYITSLKAANPTAKDVTTLLAKGLPVVRAAHPAADEVDDANTLLAIHLGVTFGGQALFDPGIFDAADFDSV